MNINLEDLEEILEYEITTYSNIEQCVLDKKKALVKGDIDEIQKIDGKMLVYEQEVINIKNARSKINNGVKTLTLSEIIEKVEKFNREKAQSLLEKKEKINKISKNIKKYDEINTELIKHALKLVENSIASIVGAFIPETKSYNSYGKSSKKAGGQLISSVVKDA